MISVINLIDLNKSIFSETVIFGLFPCFTYFLVKFLLTFLIYVLVLLYLSKLTCTFIFIFLIVVVFISLS